MKLNYMHIHIPRPGNLWDNGSAFTSNSAISFETRRRQPLFAYTHDFELWVHQTQKLCDKGLYSRRIQTRHNALSEAWKKSERRKRKREASASGGFCLGVQTKQLRHQVGSGCMYRNLIFWLFRKVVFLVWDWHDKLESLKKLRTHTLNIPV
jgi:hypothetical protein